MIDNLFSYGYHGTNINAIKIDSNILTISFNDGVYELDDQGKETNLTLTVDMLITVDINSLKFGHFPIDILKFHNKCRYIEVEKIQEKLQKYPFEIFSVYYSKFDSIILFEGSINNETFIMKIFECVEVNFI